MRNTQTNIKLPQDLELEKAIIGELLLESSAMSSVSHILRKELFYGAENSIIFDSIQAVYRKGNKIDMFTIFEELKKSGNLSKIKDGALGLTQLTSGVSSAINIEQHSRILHEIWIRRSLVIQTMEAQRKASDNTEDVYDSLNAIIKGYEAIIDSTDYNTNTQTIGSILPERIKSYTDRQELARSGKTIGVNTGLKRVNSITSGGWKPGHLIILAGRPSMGKTAIMLFFGKSAAKSGKRVAIFSLEMKAPELVDRFILSECNINSREFKTGRLNTQGESEMCNSADKLSNLQITIDDTPSMTIQQIKASCKNLQRKGGLDLVIIDYLQLITMRSANKNYGKVDEVGECSRSLKMLAKELNCPVICLSQLSRDCAKRDNPVPVLSDLRDSGAIEQDADAVVFIHRPNYYNPKEDRSLCKLIFAKQRDGATGEIDIKCNDTITQFSDWDQEMPF